MALLAEHRLAWLGPLALALDEWNDLVGFRRGFPYELAVSSDKAGKKRSLFGSIGSSVLVRNTCNRSPSCKA